MRVLDLFCGMGGWSVGFYREGFDCTGIDIVDVGYPYAFFKRDIRDFHCDGLVRPDVIVASPPCTEFSPITKLSFRKGQRGPPDPAKGMELVKETRRVIKEANPTYWLMENVMGSIPYIKEEFGKPMLEARPWALWGNLPMGIFPQEPMKHNKQFHQLNDWQRGKGGDRRGLPEDFPFDPLRSWKRARIPVWLAQTIAKACKATILGGKPEP